MASDLEHKAKQAFIDDHFELAVDLYTQAIGMSPNNAELFSDRAQANIKLQNFTEAVDDANKAIELDPSMARAYLRKGMACLKLEEFQTAKAAVETGLPLAPESLKSKFSDLIKECDECIKEEAGEQANVESSTMNIAIPPESEGLGAAAAAIPKDVQAAAKPKYRHEFYQKPEEVVVTIFAKRIPAKSVSVDFGEQILSVTIDVPGEDAYTFQQRLFGKIIPANCRYEVMSTKIEIRLAKAQAIHWTSLEYSSEGSVVQKALVPSDGFKPSYPSSKPKKDWDKLEAQVKKEEKDEKLDGDAALNKFFRDIYKDADEDTRRAMMKSFVESNGTVLSTNWNEVGSKKVEGSPPDGMEMKKWEY
nr:protein SGT1 homolog [Ipomoea trifida]